MIVNKSMYPVQTGFSVISKLNDSFSTLQTQLATGQKASTLSEMGRDLPLSLSVRSRLDKIEGFSANIDTVNLRLSFLDKTLTRFDKIEGEARNAAIQGQYGTGGINMATLPGLSEARFDEIVTMLNEDVAGRYLFGGNKTDQAPLPDSDTLLYGGNGKMGFEGVRELRAKADGVTGMGRLVTGLDIDNPQTVTVGKDTPPHDFGFKLSNITSTADPAAVVRTPPDADGAIAIEFAAQPAPGDTISIGLTMPDGTETQVKLTATTEEPAPAGSFTIGTDAAATALSFKGALEKGLQSAAKTELRAASTFAASVDFFDADGKPKIPDMPADGTLPTAMRAAADTEVVQWYRGGTVAEGQDPRATVSAAIDDSSRVNYGMQANESGFLALVRSQAALAISSYKSEETVRSGFETERLAAMAQPEGTDRTEALAAYEQKVTDAYRLETGFFDGMAKRQQAALSESHNTEPGSIEIITMQLGVAQGTLQSATERHTNYKSQLDNLLSDVETINKEEVAMQILDVQTRLQASYQTTAMVSQLSLVNYLR